MKSAIRTAVIAGALVSAAGLAAPAASAGTTSAKAPTARAAAQTGSVEAAVKWGHCEHKKPEVCSKQWTYNVFPNKVRKFQGIAVNKGTRTIKGRMGAYFVNPKNGKKYFHWNDAKTTTLKPAKAVKSKVYNCPKGWTAQAVWDAKPGSNWFSAPMKCKGV
ncbi:hypothetical protein [Actinomadura rudentiformis]|uniref:Uncharacterized protein n=1 Tax=Actinomadura rudentiformis TaxID=359158 RepID=A0A6H9YT72_9ACTN|nr:hypothetical protein [Actinomadura rudentiformis]KAB2343613.1 hypothetical protein F8566_33275 [Actinomadura rudentiformis]